MATMANIITAGVQHQQGTGKERGWMDARCEGDAGGEAVGSR